MHVCVRVCVYVHAYVHKYALFQDKIQVTCYKPVHLAERKQHTDLLFSNLFADCQLDQTVQFTGKLPQNELCTVMVLILRDK